MSEGLPALHPEDIEGDCKLSTASQAIQLAKITKPTPSIGAAIASCRPEKKEPCLSADRWAIQVANRAKPRAKLSDSICPKSASRARE